MYTLVLRVYSFAAFYRSICKFRCVRHDCFDSGISESAFNVDIVRLTNVYIIIWFLFLENSVGYLM